MKTTKIILFGLFLAVLFSSCLKKHTYVVTGKVYKDCNFTPFSGAEVYLYQGPVPGIKSVRHYGKTDANGNFEIVYEVRGGARNYDLMVGGVELANKINASGDIGAFIYDGSIKAKVKIKANNYLTSSDTLYFRLLNPIGGCPNGKLIGECRLKLAGPFNDTTLAEVKKIFEGFSLSDIDSIKLGMGGVSYSLNNPPAPSYDNHVLLDNISPCSTDNELVIELN